MKQLKSIILLMMVALLPMPALAEESGGGDELDIPEIVLEHLAVARIPENGISVRLIVCPRASSSAKSIMVRSTSVWLTARRHVLST